MTEKFNANDYLVFPAQTPAPAPVEAKTAPEIQAGNLAMDEIRNDAMQIAFGGKSYQAIYASLRRKYGAEKLGNIAQITREICALVGTEIPQKPAPVQAEKPAPAPAKTEGGIHAAMARGDVKVGGKIISRVLLAKKFGGKGLWVIADELEDGYGVRHENALPLAERIHAAVSA